MAYLLNGDQVPAPVIPSGFIDPADGAPDALSPLTNGMVPLDAVPIWHEWARSIEAQGREGTGGRCINRGLVPSDSGDPLTAEVSAGQASIDIPVTLADVGTCVVSDNIYNAGDLTVRIHLWLTQGGTLTSVNNSLTPPSTNCVYLGSCRTSAGAFVDFDLSGRMQRLQGGALVRRTADLGEPADTPPSTISFRAKTAGGTYEWTGSEWIDAAFDDKTVLTSGDHATTGTLADLITVGEDAGLTVDVEEVETGIWKIVLRSVVGDVDLTPFLRLDGTNAMTQALNFGTHKGINLSAGTLSTDAVNLGQMGTAISTAISAIDLTVYTKKDGTRAFTGNQSMGGYRLTNVPDVPTAGTDAINDNRLTAQLAGVSTTDRAVRTDTGDTTPGSLADKITYSRGLLVTQTGPPTGDRKQNFALDTRAETLPAYSVTILPGESVILAIDFSTRGSFPSADLYTVSAYYDNITSGSLGHINDWAIIRELPGHFGDALSGTAITPKTGTRCLLEIENCSPDLVAAFDESSHNFRIYTTLSGCGWEAGGSPSGTPTVTVYRYNSRKTLEFELDPVTIPKGTTGTVEVDFSGFGRYSGQYFVQAEPANTDAKVAALCSGRTHSTFQLEVTNAADAASTDVTLTVTVQGERYLAASDSLNPDTPGDPTASVLTTTSAQQEIIIATFKEASPTGSDVLLRFPCHRDVTVGGTATLAISRAWCLFRPDSSGEILIYDYEHGVGATLIGLVTFTSASDAGTFDFASYFGEVTVPAGHLITFVCGAGSDAPLAQFCINLVGLVDVA